MMGKSRLSVGDCEEGPIMAASADSRKFDDFIFGLSLSAVNGIEIHCRKEELVNG